MVKNWKSIVSAVAPSLGAALGGPLGGMAGKLISNGLIGNPDAADSDIATALMDPDNLLKLKTIERDFELKLKELDINIEKLAVDDRKSARDLAKTMGIEPQVILSSVFIAGFFVTLYFIFGTSVAMDDKTENLAFMLLGVLSSGVTMVLKFWFGGSMHDGKNMENIYNSIPREQLKK